MRPDKKKSYHHGNLAESLLNAVDELAIKFGFDAVTLRGCAKLVGVSPSSAFRHYADKRALMTAFATRALCQLSERMAEAKEMAGKESMDEFHSVGLAYVEFALEKPAFFRAMWRQEAIYTNNEDYVDAAKKLGGYLKGGFVETIREHDSSSFSPRELLAWSSVHGLSNLFIDGPVAEGKSKEEKMERAGEMIRVLMPALQKKQRAG